MKKAINDMESKHAESGDPLVSRREALQKAGKYALFTAAASAMLLTPKLAVAQSTGGLTGLGWGTGGNPSGPGMPPGGTGSSSQIFGAPQPPPSSGLKSSPWQ